jgi:hypothetical protein
VKRADWLQVAWEGDWAEGDWLLGPEHPNDLNFLKYVNGDFCRVYIYFGQDPEIVMRRGRETDEGVDVARAVAFLKSGGRAWNGTV